MNIWENDMLCVRELGMRITNTKERLILAAIELFSTKGYEGTSVEEIAKAVGIKAPSIYVKKSTLVQSENTLIF